MFGPPGLAMDRNQLKQPHFSAGAIAARNAQAKLSSPYEAPRGSMFLSGLVEVKGSSGTCTFDVVAVLDAENEAIRAVQTTLRYANASGKCDCSKCKR